MSDKKPDVLTEAWGILNFILIVGMILFAIWIYQLFNSPENNVP